ncbi:hypothetical protein BE17_18845, partial [Sorangium cellulosum]
GMGARGRSGAGAPVVVMELAWQAAVVHVAPRGAARERSPSTKRNEDPPDRLARTEKIQAWPHMLSR